MGFNSRPVEGRTVAVRGTTKPVFASTHAPVQGANSPASPAYAILSVASTHAPCGRTMYRLPTTAIYTLQLTPPRGGELYTFLSYTKLSFASTHAPVWGVRL